MGLERVNIYANKDLREHTHHTLRSAHYACHFLIKQHTAHNATPFSLERNAKCIHIYAPLFPVFDVAYNIIIFYQQNAFFSALFSKIRGIFRKHSFALAV
jgi:hypothetical protein